MERDAQLLSEVSGTGAENVGESGPERTATPEPEAAAEPEDEPRERRCEATESNPGGTNNYIPDAPEQDSLGSGFVITGLVRAADGCGALEDVRTRMLMLRRGDVEPPRDGGRRHGSVGATIAPSAKAAAHGSPSISACAATATAAAVAITSPIASSEIRISSTPCTQTAE